MNPESKKIKIIFVGRYNPDEILSGPEKVAKRIYSGLRDKTNSVFVEYFYDGSKYTIWDKLFGYEENYVHLNLEIYRLGIFRIIGLIIKFRPQLVHILTFQRFTIVFFLLKIFLHFKISYTLHSIVTYENSFFKRKIKLTLKIKDKFAEWIIIKYSDKLFFLSKQLIDLAAKFYSFPMDKIIKISNGVDDIFNYMVSQRQYFIKKKLNVLLVADSDRFEKGLRFFFEAVRPLKNEFRFYIIGRNNSEPIENVKFISKMKTEDFAKFLMGQDIFISSSLFDSFPISAIESMSAGVIPVLTKQTGVSSFIVDGVNGFSYEYGDILSLQTKLKIIKEDFELRKKLSQNSAKIYYELKWSNICSDYLNHFNEIVL